MFESFTALENVFAVCAIVGTVAFLIWLILNVVGIAGEVSADVDADFDIDAGGQSDLSFKILSFQGVTSFLMMFGLVGLALSKSETSNTVSVAGAVAAGIVAVLVIGKIFQFAKGLQSSGTINVKNAEGELGIVYLTIPAGGTGKVQVTVQSRMMEFDAIADGGETIETGKQVRVVRFISANTVAVKCDE